MYKNKMAEVAALFRKKLDEEFEVRASKYIIKTKFTKTGLKEHFFTSEWLLNGELLQMLLTGEAVIIDGE